MTAYRLIPAFQDLTVNVLAWASQHGRLCLTYLTYGTLSKNKMALMQSCGIKVLYKHPVITFLKCCMWWSQELDQVTWIHRIFQFREVRENSGMCMFIKQQFASDWRTTRNSYEVFFSCEIFVQMFIYISIYSFIHTSSINTYPVCRVIGGPRAYSIPRDLGHEIGYTLDHYRAHSHTTGNLGTPFNLVCIFNPRPESNPWPWGTRPQC